MTEYMGAPPAFGNAKEDRAACRVARVSGGLGACLALLLGVSPCPAEMLRVTTWNLGLESESDRTTAAIEETASTLKRLDPDVILLQQVTDWRMCERLAAALRPLDYHVVICSAFHGVP